MRGADSLAQALDLLAANVQTSSKNGDLFSACEPNARCQLNLARLRVAVGALMLSRSVWLDLEVVQVSAASWHKLVLGKVSRASPAAGAH